MALIACVVLIPFIYQAQRNVVEIISLFFNINHEEIIEKIRHFDNMKSEINSHFGKIQKFFNDTNFNIEIREAKVKKNNGEKKEDKNPESANKEDEEIKDDESVDLTEKLARKLRVEEITKER